MVTLSKCAYIVGAVQAVLAAVSSSSYSYRQVSVVCTVCCGSIVYDDDDDGDDYKVERT